MKADAPAYTPDRSLALRSFVTTDEARMDQDSYHASVESADAPRSSSRGTLREAERKDHFLQLMFFRASRIGGDPHAEPLDQHSTGEFGPLRNSRARLGQRFDLPAAPKSAPVRPDSRATDVMTDLRQFTPVTIGPDAPIAEANRAMVARGVRALFVVDDARQVLGIVTATDILGERPMQFAQARSIRHDEVVVRDIMTSADRLELLEWRDVLRARVGDVVATLRLSGRQHALVVEADEVTPGRRTICGMFSLTQIGRRLGIPTQHVHDIARTFGEIEALIAAQ
jgi:hypothetical protein